MKILKRQILRTVNYMKDQITTQHWFKLYLKVYNLILLHFLLHNLIHLIL
jgi:hypothetical protein